LIFLIIPFNSKTRVARSRDIICFDTNINNISHSCSCFKFTHVIVWYTLQMTIFLFCQINSYVVKTVTLLKLWDRDFIKNSEIQDWDSRLQNLCILLKFFKKVLSALLSNFFWISGIFPTCFDCFLPGNTTVKKLIELQVLLSHILAILSKGQQRQYHQRRDAFRKQLLVPPA